MVTSFGLNDIVERLTLLNTCKAGTFVLGAHMLHIGSDTPILWAYTYPQSLCKTFGLRYDGAPFTATQPGTAAKTTSQPSPGAKPSEETEQADVKNNFWPLLFAPREVAFGLMLLVLGGLGEWRAVGVIVSTVAGLLATTDGVVAGVYAKGGWSEAVTSHGIPAVVLAGMAVPLLK